MTIIHKKGSLFDAPKGSILVHACNAQGVWGSGIAAEFRKRFPLSHAEYRGFCESFRGDTGHKEHGTALLTEDNVGCLITSEDFGGAVDAEDVILGKTRDAVYDLLDVVPAGATVHSNKFNSGLFGVPWEKTEAVLKEVLEDAPDITWVVWTPED